MIDARLRRVLDAAAHLVDLPSWRMLPGPEWLEGLILAESGGKATATRYERHQDKKFDGDAPDVDSGNHEDDKSYGLMQVMGSNLRRMVEVEPGAPVAMGFSWAFRPLANIAFGLRLLSDEIERASHDMRAYADMVHEDSMLRKDRVVLDTAIVDLALARYNGGPRGNAASDWPNFRNSDYAERVYQHALMAHADRRAVGWRTVG